MNLGVRNGELGGDDGVFPVEQYIDVDDAVVVDAGAVGGVFGGVGAAHGALYPLADSEYVLGLSGAAVHHHGIQERRSVKAARFGLNNLG